MSEEIPPVDNRINNDEQRAQARAEVAALRAQPTTIEKLLDKLVEKGVLTKNEQIEITGI